MTFMRHYRALDAALVSNGFPATSPWWLETLERFYATGKRQLVLRVGRRGGKSSTLCRVGVVEALYGQHKIPPGDIGYVAIISVDRDEAARRLRTVRAILDAIDVKCVAKGDTIALIDRPVIFAVFTATIAGVSGPTCISAIADEAAKWRDKETGQNPAREVLASLRPTMATQPNARMFLSSSPLGHEDAHAIAFDLGETDHQCVAFAPTWIAHPALTEEQCHRDEPDERVFRREYGGEPQTAVCPAFDGVAVARAFRVRSHKGYVKARRVGVLDLSSGKSDATTWGVAGWNVADVSNQFVKNADGSVVIAPWGDPIPTPGWAKPDVAPFLELDFVAALEGGFWNDTTSDELDDRIANDVKRGGAPVIHADQRESFHMRGAMNTRGLVFIEHPWTATSKPKAVDLVRRWLRDDVLALPNSDPLRAELLAFEERITPSGSLTYGARGRGHDDQVALLVTLAHAELAGMVPSSPQRKKAPPRGVVATNPGFPF